MSSMYTRENALRYMAPHLHLAKGNQRTYNAGLGIMLGLSKEQVKLLRHGEKLGNYTFRLIEEDLYIKEFYRYALPIIKEEWAGE